MTTQGDALAPFSHTFFRDIRIDLHIPIRRRWGRADRTSRHKDMRRFQPLFATQWLKFYVSTARISILGEHLRIGWNMSTISKNDFIAGVRKSAVIDDNKLQEWLGNIEAKNAQEIASKLVRDQLLTKWQAKYLISGRTRLDIGSYRLLERIQRDDFGDRFLAMHTSLARKVDLQVLPSTLSQDESQCDEFMKKASLAAKLDHPNLIHVYDIDRESGRLFLVTEHVDGITLDKFSRNKLTEDGIARWASQLFAGLRYAHEQNVVHGGISQADLVLDGHEIKLQNLAISPLRQEQHSNGSAPKPEDDYTTVIKITSSLLSETPEANRSPAFAELAKIFAGIESIDSKKIDSVTQELNVWMERHAKPILDPVEKAADKNGGFDQPIATTGNLKTNQPKSPQPNSDTEETQEAELASQNIWRKKPAAVIAIAGVALTILIGGTVWGLISLFGGSGDAVAKSDNAPFGKSQRVKVKKPDSDSKQPDFQDVEQMSKLIDGLQVEDGQPIPGDQQSANAKQPVDPAQPVANTNATTPQNQNAVANPSANNPATATPPAPDNTESKGTSAKQSDQGVLAANATSPKTDSPPQTPVESSPVGNANSEPVIATPTSDTMVNTSAPPANAAAAVTPDPLSRISGIGEATQGVLYRSGITTFKQLAALSLEDLQALLKKANFFRPGQQDHVSWLTQAKALAGDTSPVSTATTKPAPASPAGPFANFPRITHLPPVTNTNEFKIADLVIKKQYLLGAELISEKGVSRTNMMFEIRRTKADKQKWIVGVKRRPKEKPTDIANFRKTENAFFFNWLPEAEKNKYANFLRNCYLKLKLPDDQSTFLTLRRPVKMPDLRLTQESLVNSIDVEIPWMPHPENIVVEVLPLRVQGLESMVAKSGIEKGFPGKIWLKRSDKTGFLWLQVGGDLRSKLKLQSNLVLLMDGQTKPVKNLKELDNVANFIKQNELRAAAHNQQTQAGQAPKTQKDLAQKQANEAAAMSARVAQYGEAVQKIMNQPVSVRVYAKLGKFQTILAVTDVSLNDKK